MLVVYHVFNNNLRFAMSPRRCEAMGNFFYPHDVHFFT